MYTDDNEYNDKEESFEKSSSGLSSKGTIILCVFLAIVLLVLVFFAFFKKDGGEDDDDSDDVTYVVTIDPSTINVNVGSSVILTATVKNSKNEQVTNPEIEWKINDTNIATVDKGVVKGVTIGKTKVTATYSSSSGQKYEDSKDVSVIEGDSNTPLTDVAFSKTSLTLNVNDTEQLELILTPSNGRVDSKVFTSSNTSVVMVDSNGLVTAVGEGTATIEVNVNNGAFVKTITVKVIDGSSPYGTYPPIFTPSPSGILAQSIKIKNAVDKIEVGKTAQLDYEITPTGVTDNTVTWVSFDNTIATVDANGVITGVAVGQTKIVVTANGGIGVSDTITIEVVDSGIKVTDINLTTTDINLTVGLSETITPIIIPDTATNKELDFIAGDSSIVQLSVSADKSSVTITALKEGTTTVTIKSSDGVEKTINVIVTPSATQKPSGGSGGSGCGSNKNLNCPAGQYAYCGKCYSCPAGNYCFGNNKTACPAGKGSVQNSSSYQDCSPCSKGFYATGNGKGCIACPNNQTTASTGATSVNDCIKNTDLTKNCGVGNYNNNGTCMMCDYGNYCSDGITKTPCSPGTGTRSGAISQTQCGSCTGKFYSTGDGKGCVKTCLSGQTVNNDHTGCTNTTATATPKPTASSFSCSGLSVSSCNSGQAASVCSWCRGGCHEKSYCSSPVTPTPTATTTPKPSSSSSSKCPIGQYLLSGVCKICPKDYYCPDGTTKRPCTGGKTTNGTGKTSFSDCKL